MFDSIKEFLGPEPNSVKNENNTEEYKRSGILGIFSSASVWLVISVVYEIIQALVSDPSFSTTIQALENFLKEKNYVAVIIGAGTFLFDVLRRKYMHGK